MMFRTGLNYLVLTAIASSRHGVRVDDLVVVLKSHKLIRVKQSVHSVLYWLESNGVVRKTEFGRFVLTNKYDVLRRWGNGYV